MATRLYIRQVAPIVPGIAKGSRSTTLPAGTANILNSPVGSLLLTKASEVNLGITYDSLGQIARQDVFLQKYATPRLAQQDLAAGTWTGAIRVRESGNLANAFLAVCAYVRSPVGGVRYIYNVSTALGNEWPTLGPRGREFTFSGAGMRIEQDEVIVVELWQTATQGDGNIYAMEAYPDGTGDDTNEGDASSEGAAWIDAPGDLVFVTSETEYTPGTTGREYGKFSARERWYHCAVCGKVLPESDTTVPVPPYPQAGLRVGNECFDGLGYEENRFLTPPPLEPPDVEVIS